MTGVLVSLLVECLEFTGMQVGYVVAALGAFEGFSVSVAIRCSLKPERLVEEFHLPGLMEIELGASRASVFIYRQVLLLATERPMRDRK